MLCEPSWTLLPSPRWTDRSARLSRMTICCTGWAVLWSKSLRLKPYPIAPMGARFCLAGWRRLHTPFLSHESELTLNAQAMCVPLPCCSTLVWQGEVSGGAPTHDLSRRAPPTHDPTLQPLSIIIYAPIYVLLPLRLADRRTM